MVDYVKYCREQADDTFYDPLKESWTMVGDRIEKLEAALDEAAFSQTLFDAVVGQRNKATGRIEKLEAALREIAYTEPEDKYWPGRIARKALETNDE